MSVTVRKRKGVRIATVRGEMTIYNAHNDKTALLGALEQGEQLEINLVNVEEIDTAGIQLLCLLRQEAAQLEKPMKLVKVNEVVREALDLFNMTDQFDVPQSAEETAS
jgi:anti-sigma B factor antagonist